MTDWEKKYFKYKSKYLTLKTKENNFPLQKFPNLIGGTTGRYEKELLDSTQESYDKIEILIQIKYDELDQIYQKINSAEANDDLVESDDLDSLYEQQEKIEEEIQNLEIEKKKLMDLYNSQ
jgi:hypothetical protein